MCVCTVISSKCWNWFKYFFAGDLGDTSVEKFVIIQTDIPADTAELESIDIVPTMKENALEIPENAHADNIDGIYLFYYNSTLL